MTEKQELERLRALAERSGWWKTADGVWQRGQWDEVVYCLLHNGEVFEERADRVYVRLRPRFYSTREAAERSKA